MADRGLALDFTQQIVNVQWGGGAVFIGVGDSEMILRAEIKREKKPVFELISVPDDFVGEGEYAGARGGSYRKVVSNKDRAEQGENAKPKGIFLLAGNDGKFEDRHTWGIIMSSPDGKTWTRAGKLESVSDIGDEAGFQAMVWDEGFHAHAFTNEYYHAETEDPDHPGGAEVDSYFVMFSSGDGTNFSESAREHTFNSEAIGGEPPPRPDPATRPAAFEAHCANNPAKLPDGTFGYYESRDSEGQIVESFLAVPKSPSHYWLNYTNLGGGGESFDGQVASKIVDITIFKDGRETKKSVETPIVVNGIAYVDGILMVGGKTTVEGDPFGDKAAIAYSTDQGNTWETVWEADQDYMKEIWVILGAPLADSTA